MRQITTINHDVIDGKRTEMTSIKHELRLIISQFNNPAHKKALVILSGGHDEVSLDDIKFISYLAIRKRVDDVEMTKLLKMYKKYIHPYK